MGQRDKKEDGDQQFCLLVRLSRAPRGTLLSLTEFCGFTNEDVYFPEIRTVSPTVVPLKGDALVIVEGVWIEPNAVVTVNGVLVNATVNGSTLSLLTPSSYRTPSNASLSSWAEQYVTLTITNPVNRSQTSCLPDCKPELELYYSDPCLDSPEGWYGSGIDCIPCPEGASCPGGYRVWPKPGFNRDGPEASQDTQRCSLPVDRCPGGRLSVCGEGYEGPLCQQCSTDYYALDNLCKPCRLNGDYWELAANLPVMLGVVAAMGLTVLFMSEALIKRWGLPLLIVLQQTAIMLGSILPFLPQGAVDVYYYLRAVSPVCCVS